MDLGLRGKVALVTGSSRGLGRAVAEELAREGCAVVICSRDPDSIALAAREIASEIGADVLPVAANLTDPDDVTRLLRTAHDRFGRVDVLVTNTGGPPAGAFEVHTPAAWADAIAQNLESVLNLVRGVLPEMKQRQWGRIVNITSIAVKQPVDGLILSNSVRAAVTGFARTLANEVAPHGITVNNVMPGYTRTERLVHLAEHNAQKKGVAVSDAYSAWEQEIPMERLGEPAELAALVTFLVSQRASYITGTSIPVDGGWIRALV
jgi:3-oxoacyl-[acyl-carrier protein] reductase